MNTLAIIIVNHNHGEMFRKCVKSLFDLPDEIEFKLIVVNNIPGDNAAEWLTENYPLVELINNQTADGFASNVNKAIRHAGTVGYFLLINPDVICLPGLLEKQICYMESNLEIGILAPRLLNVDRSTQPSARNFPTIQALVIRSISLDSYFENSRHLKNYLLVNDSVSQPIEVDWVTGAIMMIRKNALDQVGLLDERFFLYVEDLDICCRMWRKGWKVCYFPPAEAYHLHVADSRHKLLSKARIYHVFSYINLFFKYKGVVSRQSLLPN